MKQPTNGPKPKKPAPKKPTKRDIARLNPKELFSKLTYAQKEYIFRTARAEYVAEDIESQIEDDRDDMIKEIGENKLNERVQYAAKRYAFDGEYDCNLTYWDNIGNLVDKYITKELW